MRIRLRELRAVIKEAIEERLPEDPWSYFVQVAGTIMVPVDKLATTRARPEGIANAERYMRMASRGEMEKRKPISVKRGAPGTEDWIVLDGNSTTAIAKKNGWKTIPAVEEDPGAH